MIAGFASTNDTVALLARANGRAQREESGVVNIQHTCGHTVQLNSSI